MGAYSTLNITRSRALQIVTERLMDGVDDNFLERAMDKILEPRLYNCRIVADGDEYNNDDEL